ncbi:PaaI family thioesterase [Bacillus sp. ISL-18]|uniref:PaaI family thioesterase n=1 Tax=Bacillus sp. ISL-18 TaxID=2819118 RepID=UPI001BE9FE3A|nr:PaaI family thioesterase [Bacillus sp. ISL-18]MBT2654241.1 PaaI family thioesterase [Bacillus sp. ISL-18]
MKEELRHLLESILQKGSEEDLGVIKQLLEGVQNKIKGNRRTYIDGILHMETSFENECYEITIPISPVIHNNLNIVHGGITATVLDTSMGVLVNRLVPEGYGAVTNQLNIHYIAPGIGETLRCKAEVIHKGTKTMVISGEAFRSDGKKIAYATGTFFIIKKG